MKCKCTLWFIPWLLVQPHFPPHQGPRFSCSFGRAPFFVDATERSTLVTAVGLTREVRVPSSESYCRVPVPSCSSKTVRASMSSSRSWSTFSFSALASRGRVRSIDTFWAQIWGLSISSLYRRFIVAFFGRSMKHRRYVDDRRRYVSYMRHCYLSHGGVQGAQEAHNLRAAIHNAV